MADYIPFEIQQEIIKRIPDVKPLIRFRSVSKPWKSLIDSSKFIADFHITHTRPHDLFLVKDLNRQIWNYSSILDDDSLPKQKSSVLVPEFAKVIDHLLFIGSSQGLFCFYRFSKGVKTAVLWNPTIRKSVDIVVPNALNDSPSFNTIVSFGDCPYTRDPMLVKINYIYKMSEIDNISHIPWQVEVFTLSSRAWRSPLYSSNLPRKSIRWKHSYIVVDKFIYWLVTDWNHGNTKYQIMSFDMAKEEFADIYLPSCITSAKDFEANISKVRGDVAVLIMDYTDTQKGCGVWVMHHGKGVRKSFKKCFTIRAPDGAPTYHVLGFRKKSYEAIIATRTESGGKFDLSLYEPYSKQINDIGISVNILSCFSISYMETLLLLDF